MPIAWNAQLNSRIVPATFCCEGPVIEELVRPYVPEAQLWGDGRYLWSNLQDDGSRQIYIAQLSKTEMTELLQAISTSGFFDLDEQYEREQVIDAANRCLAVTLTDQKRVVCATDEYAPDKFYALFDWLAMGAGRNGDVYQPERGHLTGFMLDDIGIPLPEPDVVWPEALAHMPVGETIEGYWLDDEVTLRVLWQAVNHNPYRMPVVGSEGDRYRLILQIPGVSWIEP